QAEDGIRDSSVTGVQTCALPISAQRCRGDASARLRRHAAHSGLPRAAAPPWPSPEPAQLPGAVAEGTLMSYRAFVHDHFLMRNLPIKLRFPMGTPFQRRML